jgi:hypothetical protein
MTLIEIHGVLTKAFGDIAALLGHVDDVSPDPAVAIGEALGLLGKAKALVGRDIDTAVARSVVVNDGTAGVVSAFGRTVIGHGRDIDIDDGA